MLDLDVIVVLDEAANRAVPQLRWGGLDVRQPVSAFWDLAQINERYGPHWAATILKNHRAKLFGPGISDPW